MATRVVKIGVLSDTHIAKAGNRWDFLGNLRDKWFKDADMVLHAGDFTDPDVLTAFHPIPVVGVRGNMDPLEIDLPLKKIIALNGGKRIGLIHGWGHPRGLCERVLREWEGESLDCLVFGHSHVPVCFEKNGLLLFNPGSATMGRGGLGATIGLLEICDRISGKILPLDGTERLDGAEGEGPFHDKDELD